MTKDHTDSPDRRTFFKSAADKLIEPVANYLENKISATPERSIIRPPGAINESMFNETCHRCGECVKACPASAIFPLADSFGEAASTPAIDPSKSPCVVCEGLQCTHVCPSGALLPVYESHLIAMGVAEVYAPICVRTDGENCTICLDRCPFGETAIRYDGESPPVILNGCTGCGICEFYCPTTPKAITIRPA